MNFFTSPDIYFHFHVVSHNKMSIRMDGVNHIDFSKVMKFTMGNALSNKLQLFHMGIKSISILLANMNPNK
mgnify:CR=1 FL=1